MKILGINGSYRGAKGKTGAFMELLLSGASIAGAECESVHLADHKINRCLSCGRCHSEEHFLQCVWSDKDDVTDIYAKIAACDIVVYATPVYIFGISGLLKLFIDRFYGTADVGQIKMTKSGLVFHHVNEEICSKPFVSLICCDNMDDQMPLNAKHYFRTYSRFMDAPQVGELVRDGCLFFQDVRKCLHQEDFLPVNEIYNAFQKAGYELAMQGRISSVTQRKASGAIIPIPFFNLLRRLKSIKQGMVIQANTMLTTRKHQV